MKRTLLTLALAFATIASAASAQDDPSTPAARAARNDIERAGYRDVQGLAQDAQGVWHGRALRGNTEVQLLVDRDGNVEINR
jgi:hypothetical protein